MMQTPPYERKDKYIGLRMWEAAQRIVAKRSLDHRNHSNHRNHLEAKHRNLETETADDVNEDEDEDFVGQQILDEADASVANSIKILSKVSYKEGYSSTLAWL